jgi:cytochrome P450
LYDSVITVFLLNFFPKYVVPKAFKARERLVDRFKVYHRNSESSDMADLIRRRVQICRQYGCSDDYLGRSELELVNGLLSNMVPTLFWMLTHIVLDGSLASTINNEVAQILQPKNGEGASSSTTNTTTLHFEFAQVRDKCPTLVATYHEVLRLYASSARAYQVTEDFMLTDNYLLRKGSMVTIPVEVLHKSPNNWGPDASQFRPNRWINPDSAPHHPAAWAPFGGGSSICPGRYFVFDLILSIAIMVLYSFDLEIVSGEKQLPERRTKIMSGVRLPEKDPDILMRRRRRADQDGEVVWSFKKEASPSVKERD